MANEIKAQELVQGIDGLAKEIADLVKSVAALREEFTKTQTVFDKNSKSQSELANKTKAVSVADAELEKIRARQNKITIETIRATEELKDKRKKLTDQVRAENGTLKKSGGLWQTIAKGIIAANVATTILRTTWRSITDVIKKSVETNTLFSKGMSEVKAITKATSTEFTALYDNALVLGATTAKSAVEISKLQKEFAKLGFSSKEILNATEATINLSIATGSDLSQSAVVAATTIRGFGLDAKNSTKIVDIMAESFTSSALDLEKFKTSMAISAPIAKNFGKDLEFTTAQLAVLADTGIDASTSGTSLRNIFLELSKRGLTWEEGLQKINESTNKNVTALNLFGKRGATAAVILADNTEKAGRLEKQFRNSAGAAKRMADIMQDNLAGDTVKASSAMEGLYINIGKRLDPALRSVTQGFTRFISNINESLNPLKEQTNLYGLQDKELTTLFGSLKNTNLSQEARNKLIDQVNTTYGKYLPNLLTEQSTLEDIEKAETAINKQLRLKVIQQAFQEEINDLLKAELNAKEQLVTNEIARDQLAQKKLQSSDVLSAEENKAAAMTLDLMESLTTATLENNAKEIESTEDKFKRIGELYGIAFAEIETILNQNIDVVKEIDEEIVESAEKTTKKTSKLEKENNKLIVEYAKETDEALKALEQENFEFNEGLSNDELENLKKQLEEELRLKNEAAEEEIALEKAKEARKTEIKNAAYEAAGQIVSDRLTAGIDEELAKFQDSQDAKEAILQSQLDSGAISEAEYEKKVRALRLKTRQEEAKAAKKSALYDIAIKTAVAIIAQLSIPGAGFALAAAVAVLGGIQAAVIASKPLPKYEDGEINIKGNRHSNGGIDANIEGGESVINRTGTKNATKLLTAINKGLISDSDVLLPSSFKMFKGADTPELAKQFKSDIDLTPLIKEQQLTRRAIESKSTTKNWTKDGLIELDSRTKSRKNYRSKWLH